MGSPLIHAFSPVLAILRGDYKMLNKVMFTCDIAHVLMTKKVIILEIHQHGSIKKRKGTHVLESITALRMTANM